MKYLKKSLNIESISATKCVKDVPCKIIIKGKLNDPAWEISEPKITINQESNIVSIQIHTTRNPNQFAPQVITPVQIEKYITFPSSGEWTIRCNDYVEKILVEEIEDI